MLRQQLYGTSGGEPDDVRIVLNSYGGSCNAATQMFDMLMDYPGTVHITISGTAASAATVLAMAADELTMTPGSLYMIHDPATIAWGNEREMMDAINLLRACKESIINVYELRCRLPHDDIASMMSATTWMDATEALEAGFIDKIGNAKKGVTNASMPRTASQKLAEAKVAAYFERQRLRSQTENRIATPTPEPTRSGVPVEQLHKRLDLIKK